jgi:hypothetical protein
VLLQTQDLIVLLSMPSAVQNRVDARFYLAAEMLRGRVTIRLKALGMSMLPTLWPGDLLTIQSARCDEVAAGDIVLVARDDRFFVHRLIGWQLGPDCLLCITRGDALPHDDEPAAASELLGRVSGIRRGNRSFVPSRQVSVLHYALARMLYNWDRFRNLALRVHAVRSKGTFLRDGFGGANTIPSALARTSLS